MQFSLRSLMLLIALVALACRAMFAAVAGDDFHTSDWLVMAILPGLVWIVVTGNYRESFAVGVVWAMALACIVVAFSSPPIRE